MARTPKTSEDKQKVVAKKITKKDITKEEKSQPKKKIDKEIDTSKAVSKKATNNKSVSATAKKTKSSPKVKSISITTDEKSSKEINAPKIKSKKTEDVKVSKKNPKRDTNKADEKEKVASKEITKIINISKKDEINSNLENKNKNSIINNKKIDNKNLSKKEITKTVEKKSVEDVTIENKNNREKDLNNKQIKSNTKKATKKTVTNKNIKKENNIELNKNTKSENKNEKEINTNVDIDANKEIKIDNKSKIANNTETKKTTKKVSANNKKVIKSDADKSPVTKDNENNKTNKVITENKSKSDANQIKQKENIKLNNKNNTKKVEDKSKLNKENDIKNQDLKPVRELKLVLRSELEEIERKENERKEKEKIEAEKTNIKNEKIVENKSELNKAKNIKSENINNSKNKQEENKNKSDLNKQNNKNNPNNKNVVIKQNNQIKSESQNNNKKDVVKNNIPNNQKNIKAEIQKAETNKDIKNNIQNNQKSVNSENKNINNKYKNTIPEKKITREEIDNYFKSGEYIIKGREDKKNNKNKSKSPQQNKIENEIKINQDMLLNYTQRREAYFKKIFNQIEEFVIKELYLDESIKIVVAVSGGADSIVLLDILANLSVKNSYTLFVAHVDHGLRKESNQDLEHVKNLCAKYNIKFYSKKVNVKEHANKKKMSTEEAARELRYDFLEEVCAKTGSSFLALAHNSNDSAETFFINLLRGSGLSGLSGIPQKRPLNTQVNIIRPIINLTRKEIEEYANKRKLKWVEDKTNKENIYLRNKIRNELIPFIEEKFERDIISSINKASKLINSADVFIYHKIKKYLNDVLIEKKISYVEIDLKKLFLFDDFVKGEILNLILKNIFELNNTTQNIIKGILNLYFSEPGAVFSINTKITAYKDRDSLFIARNQLFRNNSIVIENLGEFKFENKIFKLSKIPKSKVELGVASNIEYFDMDYMPKKLEIRHIQDGDKYTPIGMTGRVKISDFLVNNKIPLLKKKDILLLTDRVNIVWVCGLRISDKYKITDSTKNILKVEIIEKTN